jgi:hypothetical protein
MMFEAMGDRCNNRGKNLSMRGQSENSLRSALGPFYLLGVCVK